MTPSKPTSTTPVENSGKRLSPLAGAVTAVGVGLLVRQLVGLLGMGEAYDIYGTLRVTGIMTLAAVISWWAGRLTGRLPVTFALAALAGVAAGSFAHETVPAAAGLVILTYAGMRVVSRFLRWSFLYVFAVVYGGSLGVGAHYLVTLDEEWYRYPQAGLAVLVGLALAGYVSSWFGGDDELQGRFARLRTAWNKLNRGALLAAAALGLSASLYGLQGQDLGELAARIRQPIEEKVAEIEEAGERLNQAHDFKTEVDRFLNRDE